MARIDYFDPKAAEGPLAKKTFAKLAPLNIFRMMGHSGEMIEGYSRLGAQILNFSSIDPQLREIAIIRVGVLSGSEYEVHQHDKIGEKVGLSAAKLAAIREGAEAGAFSESEKVVMRLTDDVVANVRAGEETFNPALALLGPKALQELVITIGFYMLTCRFLRTFDVDIEAQAIDLTPLATQRKSS